jgi:O-antigen/teichoic acid export membrane protein
MPTGTRGKEVAARTLRGMFWAYGSYLGLRLSTLLATAILAHLLTPGDFGVVAIATTAMAFLEMLQGLGVSQALVVADEQHVDDQADTAFTLSVSLGLAMAIITAALGPIAADFFHQPELTKIMPVLGTTFFILSLSSTHYALAMRNIDFRSRTIAELGEALTRGGFGIALALAGAGVWSLVFGYVAGNLAMTVLLWRLVRWRPRRPKGLHHLRALMSFGGFITGISVLSAFGTQFDNLVVGRGLGATQLGFYSIATKVPYLFILNIAVVAGQVLFPAFASLDSDALRRGLITSYRYIATVVFPLTIFLIVLAGPLINAVFGSRWQGAVAATQVLCLWAMMSPISMVSGNAFMSRGRASIVFYIAIPQVLALIAGSLIFVQDGIVAISWVQACIAIVAQIVTLEIARRTFQLPLRSLGGAFLPPIVAAGALAAVLLLAHELISSAWPVIVVGAAGGGAVYLLALHTLAPDLIPGVRRMIFARGVPAS